MWKRTQKNLTSISVEGAGLDTGGRGRLQSLVPPVAQNQEAAFQPVPVLARVMQRPDEARDVGAEIWFLLTLEENTSVFLQVPRKWESP